jgi:hypothetical protein
MTCTPQDWLSLFFGVAVGAFLWGFVGAWVKDKRKEKIMTPEQENQMLEAYYRNHWTKLMCGVRVDGDTVVITVKGGNDAARCLCGELIKEMEIRSETKLKEKNT